MLSGPAWARAAEEPLGDLACRGRELAWGAHERGLACVEGTDVTGLSSLPFESLRLGAHRGVANVWSRSEFAPLPPPERAASRRHDSFTLDELHVFDLWWCTEVRGSNSQSKDYKYRYATCATAVVPGIFPRLKISPEGFFDWLRSRASGSDLKLEWEEFNSAFQVSCEDENFARTFLDANMMGFLVEFARSVTFEIAGRHILCSTDQLDPARQHLALLALQGFVDHIPPLLAIEHGVRQSG